MSTKLLIATHNRGKLREYAALLDGLSLTLVTPDELGRRLGFERRRRSQSSGQDAPVPLQVRIRSDRRVPYRFVEPIMLAAFRQQIYDVTFAVRRSQDAPP